MARIYAHISSLLLSLCIMLSAVHFTPAFAANREITVDADARVEAEHPDTNYGQLRRLSADGKPRMESYLRFNVFGVSGIKQAQLRLWTISGAAVLPTVTRADNNWSEKTITWNKRPARKSDPITTHGGTRPEHWLTLDVTNLIDKEGTYTFFLAQNSSDGLSFDARESEHPARLIITPGAKSSPTMTTTTTTPTSTSTTKATTTVSPVGTHSPTVTATASPTGTSLPTTTGTAQPDATPTRQATPSASPTASPSPMPSDTPKATPTDPPSPSGKTYYVAKSGNNSDGRSWGNAWNDVDRIRWSSIKPGDLILIKADTYNSRLVVGASGTTDAPIWIRASGGVVRLFGGRDTPLPYCDQPDYAQHGRSGDAAIDISGQSNIVIDGAGWAGIKIYGWNYGFKLKNGAHDLTVKYVEVYDNGIIETVNGRFRPRMHGVTLEESVHDVTFDRTQFHDNGSDAFHSYGGTTNFTLRESWLYNSRKAPNGDIFNHCTHPDGIHLQNSNFEHISNVLVEQNVMGPGLYHSIFASGTSLKKVVFRDVLIYNVLTSTFATRTNGAQDWVLDHVTAVQPDNNSLNLEISAGSGHIIKNSLTVGGSRNKLASGTSFQNNYQSGVGGTIIGVQRTITFRDPKNGDYTPVTDVNGAGSRLTSIESLLSR